MEEDIPVFEVEEDIQCDIEEMERAVEVMTVEDLSMEELDIFAYSRRWAKEQQNMLGSGRSTEGFNQLPLDATVPPLP